MTNDLISRSMLLGKAITVHETDEGGWERVLRAVPVEEIEAAEAVEAKPVVHSEWVRVPIDFTEMYRCGNIDCARNMPDGCKPSDLEYCPHCGAKMDGGEA